MRWFFSRFSNHHKFRPGRNRSYRQKYVVPLACAGQWVRPRGLRAHLRCGAKSRSFNDAIGAPTVREGLLRQAESISDRRGSVRARADRGEHFRMEMFRSGYAGSRTEYRSCAVFLMQDQSTRRVYRLYDFTKSLAIDSNVLYEPCRQALPGYRIGQEGYQAHVVIHCPRSCGRRGG